MPKKRPRTQKPLYPVIGLRIKEAREKAGLSQGDMAKALGHKNRQRYAHYEYGMALPKSADLMKLCEVLGLSPMGLLRESSAAFLKEVDLEVREERAPYEDPVFTRLRALWAYLNQENRGALLLSAENAVRAAGESVEEIYAAKSSSG